MESSFKKISIFTCLLFAVSCGSDDKISKPTEPKDTEPTQDICQAPGGIYDATYLLWQNECTFLNDEKISTEEIIIPFSHPMLECGEYNKDTIMGIDMEFDCEVLRYEEFTAKKNGTIVGKLGYFYFCKDSTKLLRIPKDIKRECLIEFAFFAKHSPKNNY